LSRYLKQSAMPFSAQVLKVMIASPSDVVEERAALREILHAWNDVHAAFRKLVLLPVSWETNTTPTMGAPAQEIINEQILEEADILIGIFWTRLGSATTSYKSGTVEEIKKHTGAGKIAKLYFSSTPVRPDSVDPEQYKSLNEFKAECKANGLFETFENLADFQAKFSRQLAIELNREIYSQQQQESPSAEPDEDIPLSEQATELLSAAVKDQHGHIMHLKHFGGENIQTNGRQFITDGSPRNVAIWTAALEELHFGGFIKSLNHERNMYAVTREGYEWGERYLAALPLTVEVSISGVPPLQNVLLKATKRVQLLHIAYMFSNETTIADEDVSMEGLELNSPINQGLLLTLWNSARPDKSGWDHSGPAKLGLTIAWGQRRQELILPIQLDSQNVNNVMQRKVTGKKLFSNLG
jgi:hypothetical protein